MFGFLPTVKARRTLLAVLVVAFVLRALAVIAIPGCGPDGREYDQIAQNVRHAHGFSLSPAPPFVPETLRDPLYPLFLSGLYTLFGRVFQVVYWAQALLSTFAVYLIGRIAQSLFGVRIALTAAALTAFHLPSIIYVPDILTETLYTVLLLSGFALVCNPRLRISGAGAGLLGLAVLTRSEALAFALILIVFSPLISTGRWSALSWKRAAVTFVCLLSVISPWLVRNYYATGIICLRNPAALFAALSVGTGRTFEDELYKRAFVVGSSGPALRAYERQVLRTYVEDWRRAPLQVLRYKSYQLLRVWAPALPDRVPVSTKTIAFLLGHRAWRDLAMRLVFACIFGFPPLMLAILGVSEGVRRNRSSAVLLVYPVFITLLMLPICADLRYALVGQLMLAPFIAIELEKLAMLFRAGRESSGAFPSQLRECATRVCTSI